MDAKKTTQYDLIPSVLNSEERKQKNYLIVNRSPKGDYVVTKLAIVAMTVGVLLLLLVAILSTYFVTAHYTENQPCPESRASLIRVPVAERLPRNVQPIDYKIRLLPDLDSGNFSTEGNVSIRFTCLQDSFNVTLNAEEIDINEGSVSVCLYNHKATDCSPLPIKDHMYNANDQTYVIMLGDNLVQGRNYTVEIHFQSYLNDRLQGFYRSSYVDKYNQKRWMASTQFSPTDARRAFPCFDEPDRKARFTITIARNVSRHTLSNMPLKETTTDPSRKDVVWDHYGETPIMSTYLIAFIASDLVNSSSKLNPSKFVIWSRPDVIEYSAYSKKLGQTVLTYLENYFGIPFPLPKIDLVAVPDFGFNAMENWGLITFREAALLFDEKISTDEAKQSIAVTLSHEIGHQWFGNLVTPKWWDDLWLKEGFATYLAYLSLNHAEPSWRMSELFVIEELSTALQLDALKSSHPISVPVTHTDQIREIFDTISYKKGASIIRMMNFFLGESTFKNGLISYLKKYAYSNAVQDDLWDSLTEQAHNDSNLPKDVTVKEIMDTWTLETGYPLITVTRNYQDNSAVVKQKRFLLHGEPENNHMWYVPITYTTQTNSNTNTTIHWLAKKNEMTIKPLPGADQWVQFNIDYAGFYRVNYDKQNWQMLTDNYIHLIERTRAQLIDDALNIARAGALNYTIALNMLQQLARDIKYMPWNRGTSAIDYLHKMLVKMPVYGKFKAVMATISDSVSKYLGQVEKPSDSHLTKLNRIQIFELQCSLGEINCVRYARYQFRIWMTNPQNNSIITPNLRYTTYCTSIWTGDENEWNFAYDMYLKTNIASEKDVLLSALGCSRETWLLTKYLNDSISPNSGIRKQDGTTVFISVASNPVGFPIAFKFLRNNWGAINDYFGSGFSRVSKMVASLHNFINTEAELKELESFRNENIDNLGTSARSFQQSIEKARANVNWMKNNYNDVERWLDNFSRNFGL